MSEPSNTWAIYVQSDFTGQITQRFPGTYESRDAAETEKQKMQKPGRRASLVVMPYEGNWHPDIHKEELTTATR
jgi:hypothetical protein